MISVCDRNISGEGYKNKTVGNISKCVIIFEISRNIFENAEILLNCKNNFWKVDEKNISGTWEI